MERATRQREAIERAFHDAERPLSPGEVHELAQRDVPNLGIATVYRNLKRLVDAQQIVPVNVPGEPPRYERSEAAEHHHHHFHCRRCGRVFDIEGCPTGLGSMLPPGFRAEDHEITFRGICADCTRHAERPN